MAINDSALSSSVTSLARQVGENVGGYNYAAGTLALSGSAATNYAAVFVPGASLLNITPAALSITADDKTRLPAVPNPPFTASYSGIQFGETPTVLSGTLGHSPRPQSFVASGAYTITPSGQNSSNYAIRSSTARSRSVSKLRPTPSIRREWISNSAAGNWASTMRRGRCPMW